jgi:hypothetical protein
MIQAKVRCEYCGAKNTDITKDRCRICGGLLPDASERRKRTTEGETFKALVDAEVESWQDYSELNGGSRSRRPAELPPVFAQTAVPGQDMTAAAAVATAPIANGIGYQHDYEHGYEDSNGYDHSNGYEQTNGYEHTNGNGNLDDDGADRGRGGRLRRLFNKSAD